MPNYKIIGGDQKQYGPVTAEELRQWIAEGRLSGESLVLTQDGGTWQHLSTLPEFADALRSQVGAPPVVGRTISADQILTREPELRIGECLGAGWKFFASDAAFVFAAVLVVGVLNLVMAFTPFIGGMVHLLFSGVLVGGLYLACLRRMRGEPAAVGDVFAGFKLCFVQLMLAGSLTTILTQIGFLFCIVPGIFLTVVWVFALPLVADNRLEFWSAMELSRKVVTRVWFKMFWLLVIVFLPVIAFNVFSGIKTGTMLYGMWEEAHFDVMRLLEIFKQHTAELVAAGVKLALVGQAVLIVNMLFAVGALMHAYENLFGPRKP
ncbi:MAG: GYF domain-containing protein [Verrucomicrobia bacterium]|jgi:hypothetical protein|nr:GYF domain-containing protein [Verrucomicrobiota bacterium]